MVTFKKAPGRAQFEISIDGKPNSYRDRKDIAIAAAGYLKRKFPHSDVVVKHAPSREVTVAAYKLTTTRTDAAHHQGHEGSNDALHYLYDLKLLATAIGIGNRNPFGLVEFFWRALGAAKRMIRCLAYLMCIRTLRAKNGHSANAPIPDDLHCPGDARARGMQ